MKYFIGAILGIFLAGYFVASHISNSTADIVVLILGALLGIIVVRSLSKRG
ncbi:hypothetical protein KDD93_08590 [Campylobacter sp. faydin G-24]|uniref:GlsB/YeaQ/YmgE family stress response membrane protein n=1 Tax=Campylobacter anatolicus TaxID=2829105 RepID=A0ABS5HK08_9BACT|nr:hypothetical protein [Campylobacter anatolicus]MBR8461259.1 hypothetical protein [Campylobacter anatolicus]MBR8464614.1 hypothetical protein [Campylobacter anatolicus]MBR8466448.1 hypothetical protein [Campylobacter anatolicus]